MATDAALRHSCWHDGGVMPNYHHDYEKEEMDKELDSIMELGCTCAGLVDQSMICLYCWVKEGRIPEEWGQP